MGILELKDPVWFYRLDILIQFFGTIVATFIAYYTYKAYRLTSKKTYLYLSVAFGLLALNLLVYAIAIPLLAIYYVGSGFITNLLPMSTLLLGVKVLNALYVFSILAAYTLLIFAYSNALERRIITFLTTLFILLLSISSVYLYKIIPFETSVAFNVVSLILIGTIIYYTYNNYARKKNKNTLFVLSAFVLIGLYHLLTLLEGFGNMFFLAGHFAQLLGYISLLLVVYKH